MEKRKKLYFLINSLEWWGAERVVSTLCQHFSSTVDVYLIVLKDTSFYTMPAGVHYIPLSRVRHNILLFLGIPYFVWKLRRVLRTEWLSYGVSFLEIANFVHILAKKKAIISMRTSLPFFTGVIGAVYKRCMHLLYPRAGTIITNSQENADLLSTEMNLDHTNIQTIYNPVDVESIALLKKEPLHRTVVDFIGNCPNVFITTGRLVPSKHHEIILEALTMLYRTRPSIVWKYIIVGDGPCRAALEQQVVESWLSDNALFAGSQKNIFPYLAASNLFLYSSSVEWFPNVLLEAIVVWLSIYTTNFTTGAQEVMFADWIPDQYTYTYETPNGFLVHPAAFGKFFVENIDTILQKKTTQKWLKNYDITHIIWCREAVLFTS